MPEWHYQFNKHELGQTPGDWGPGGPGVLQSMGLQTVGHDWVTEHNREGKANYLNTED